MKHWQEHGGVISAISITDDAGDRSKVLSIEIGDGVIVFQEECDLFFFVKKTPAEAIEALQEAIDYIKSKTAP